MGKRTQREESEFRFHIDTERPEETHGNPLLYYTDSIFESYVNSKSLMRTQEKITRRAVELLEIKNDGLIIDIGMGCGFSTATLVALGFSAVGIDIHRGMLSYYDSLEFNPIESDFKYLPFRASTFDAAVSISAIQWIFGILDSEQRKKAIQNLVYSLAHALKLNGKVVIQFYPRSDEQMKELGAEFVDSSLFEGTFVIDNPESPRKRKIYLLATKIKEIQQEDKK